MRIHSLRIRNFRGIKELDWTLPRDQDLIVLIGAGDSGKSTILDAIHYLLSDRWQLSLSDLDFFGVDVDEPIEVRAVLVDVPDKLKKDTTYGLWLSGLGRNGEVLQDPEDGIEPCLIVQLRVDESLEPKWSVVRPEGDETDLRSSHRTHFSTFKVDTRTDTQLRWTRTSALGKLSRDSGEERAALNAAARAAREALDEDSNEGLSRVTETIQKRANAIGGGTFEDIRPGLDASRSTMGAILALYEGSIPLMNYGAGSRRLASMAAQQLAAGDRSVAVIDELEEGLEPHRAIRLLQHLQHNSEYGQVIATSHSPVIVEQAGVDRLVTVTNHDGVVGLANLGEFTGKQLAKTQKYLRARPSSFLARRIVIGEGATEYGVLLELAEHWDQQRAEAGATTRAGEGVALHDAGGGSEAALHAKALADLGYEVAVLMDNDDKTVNRAVRRAQESGAEFFRWEVNNSLESQILADAPKEVIGDFIDLYRSIVGSDDKVLVQLNTDTVGEEIYPQLGTWDVQVLLEEDGVTLEDLRNRVARVAGDHEWLKAVDRGRALGQWLTERAETPGLVAVWARLNAVRDFIYQSGQPTATDDADEF